MERNARIRLQIMLIAVIGGLAFLSYLLVNVVLAAVNADRLDQLQHHHYPIIEEIRLLQQDLNGLRDGFATAVGMEDPVMLEDTRQLVQQVRDRLDRLRSQDPELKEEVDGIGAAFEAYAQPALLLAEALVTDPQQLPGYKGAMEASLRDYQLLSDWIGGLHATRQATYRDLLRETNLAVNRANQWGAGLGVSVILVLGILAWAISARVVKEINRSDRMKDEFLSAISHELRTPMNGIIGSLSLLRATTTDTEQQSWLDVANRSASSMMSSIDDLLQFSELMATQEALHVGEFRLRQGLTKLVVGLRPEFDDKNIALEFYGGVVLDRVLISHEGKILYVIRHLLSNALKFSEHGPVCLTVAQVNKSAGEGEGSL
ncbi:MAG TPA: histidine kinase dimerization/phospho-acceptor domain-containing protein, partial [Dongiaceae bacterium]|nr:histidine kinase dimerization/phospho-acceptor domain-containing protein [Dongiaceae bacterium]